MAENVNVAGEKELQLLEIIKEKNERVEQLEKDLNDKEILIKSLQSSLNAKEMLNVSLESAFTNKDKLSKFLKEKLRQFGVGVSAERFEAEPMLTVAEKSDEKERKIMKGEKDEVDQPENISDSDLNSQVCSAEAAAKLSRISLIVTKILKTMRTRDLLQNCRLVSREWRDFSTAFLLKRSTFRIEFTRSTNFFEGHKLNSPRKLEDLTTFLSSSTATKFPCAHFIFNGNLDSADAQAFFSQFGSLVKGLKLIGPQNLGRIRNLLLEQIPHLEILELNKFEVSTAGPVPQLSSLTSLKLGEENTDSLVREILNAAPNLQEVFGIRKKDEIEYLCPQRIHIFKGLKIKLKEPNGMFLLLCLESMMPILQHLRLTNFELKVSDTTLRPLPEAQGRSFFNSVSKVLTLSQTSLKKFKFAPHPDFGGLIQWPQLPNVEKLTLAGDLTTEFPRLFPPLEIELEMFPNLHTIHLKEIHIIKDEHISIFKQQPQISTVKRLKITQPQAQNLEIFLPLFPNLKHLSLAQVKTFADFAPLIWQMKGLKSLEIDFNCPGSEIDAGFTGLEKSTCRFLATAGRDEFTVEQVEKFRVRPSILEAKELEHLFLPRGFSEKEEYDENLEVDFVQQDFSKATSVSFKYAFNLKPNLCLFPHAEFWN